MTEENTNPEMIEEEEEVKPVSDNPETMKRLNELLQEVADLRMDSCADDFIASIPVKGGLGRVLITVNDVTIVDAAEIAEDNTN